jgi:putative ABC transport system permease protein
VNVRARWSARLYRLLLRIYPHEFRDRFGDDLERDFADLIAARGALAAWRSVLADLVRSVPSTYNHVGPSRRRRRLFYAHGESAMGTLRFDIRHALRALIQAPVFTLVTVTTLGLGIGASSAIFTLVNAVLLRPLGYADPDRLFLLYEQIPESKVPRFGVSPSDYLDLLQMQKSFDAVGVYRTRSTELSGLGEPQQITVAQMAPSVFQILGASTEQGRILEDADAVADGQAAVLSHGLWQRAYGGRAMLGERIVLDRRPYTVVGVMPAAFQFPKRGPELNGEPADAYVPLVFNPFERQARGMFYNHSVIGRLRRDISREQLAAEARMLGPRLLENYPANLQQSGFSLVVQTAPLVDEISGQVRRPLLILLGAVGLVLLVACANVANLILSRAVARQHEIGLRVALGAARHRLLQMLLAESILLALASGVAGLLIGQWTIRAMPKVIASSLPAVSDVTLDARVVLFTFGIAAATALIFSLVPLAAGGRDLNTLLRAGSSRSTTGTRQHRLQASLVVGSVGLAFVLLVASGLLIRSLDRLLSRESGVRADNVLSLHVDLPYQGYRDAARVRAFYRTLHERLRALPGVQSASIASDLPLTGDGERRVVTPERPDDGGDRPPSMAVTWIHGDYFSTFGIPLVRGRSFSSDEQEIARDVAIVSRGLAERYWPGEDPIGKRVKWGIASSPGPWKTVVGVAGDVVDGALGSEPILHVYVPYTDVPDQALAAPVSGLIRRMVVAVHANVDATTLVQPSRGAIAALDPALAVYGVETMAQVISDASAPQRFSATVLTAFAAGALLLAGIGLYGILAFGVAQRTREIGVRLALGANRTEVIGMVIRRGMTLTAIGLALGAIAAIAGARVMQSVLYETSALDPWTFVTVPAVLAAVSLIACWLPAQRAAMVDPLTALRVD